MGSNPIVSTGAPRGGGQGRALDRRAASIDWSCRTTASTSSVVGSRAPYSRRALNASSPSSSRQHRAASSAAARLLEGGARPRSCSSASACPRSSAVVVGSSGTRRGPIPRSVQATSVTLPLRRAREHVRIQRERLVAAAFGCESRRQVLQRVRRRRSARVCVRRSRMRALRTRPRSSGIGFRPFELRCGKVDQHVRDCLLVAYRLEVCECVLVHPDARRGITRARLCGRRGDLAVGDQPVVAERLRECERGVGARGRRLVVTLEKADPSLLQERSRGSCGLVERLEERDRPLRGGAGCGEVPRHPLQSSVPAHRVDEQRRWRVGCLADQGPDVGDHGLGVAAPPPVVIECGDETQP